MDYLAVGLAALFVSALALYSGFGLGTLLMPIFALFFPIPVAVASTAVVHLSNNFFKILLVGRNANLKTVVAFAVPAAAMAVLGALLLVQISDVAPLGSYSVGEYNFSITTLNLVIAILILFFAAFELIPTLRNIELPQKFVPVGGAVSGFFGGLSGHQGALRSAVLAKTGLDTGSFVGTTAVCAMIVDISRILVYGYTFFADDFSAISEGNSISLVIVATVAAFLGTYLSSRFLQKVTMKTVRTLVGGMLIAIGISLGAGLI